MKNKDELARRQAEMRRKGIRVRPKPKQLGPIEKRSKEILAVLEQSRTGCMSLDLLRALTATRPFGTGWWGTTITELCRARVLQKVDLGSRGTQIGLREKIQAIYFPTRKPEGAGYRQ